RRRFSERRIMLLTLVQTVVVRRRLFALAALEAIAAAATTATAPPPPVAFAVGVAALIRGHLTGVLLHEFAVLDRFADGFHRGGVRFARRHFLEVMPWGVGAVAPAPPPAPPAAAASFALLGSSIRGKRLGVFALKCASLLRLVFFRFERRG